METAWIQVFILTLTQCIAPAGKMVCQEETVEYHFTNQDDCARALVHMVDLAARADNILVNEQRSDCKPGVMASSVFASDKDARSSLASNAGVVLVDNETPSPDFLKTAHEDRLKDTRSCDETSGVAPCKVGNIIIEPAAEPVRTEVWRQQE